MREALADATTTLTADRSMAATCEVDDATGRRHFSGENASALYCGALHDGEYVWFLRELQRALLIYDSDARRPSHEPVTACTTPSVLISFGDSIFAGQHAAAGAVAALAQWSVLHASALIVHRGVRSMACETAMVARMGATLTTGEHAATSSAIWNTNGGSYGDVHGACFLLPSRLTNHPTINLPRQPPTPPRPPLPPPSSPPAPPRTSTATALLHRRHHIHRLHRRAAFDPHE